MASSASDLGKHVRHRYAEEARRLQAHWPAEQVTLEELRSRRQVKLMDGTYHEMDSEEAEALMSQVPSFFWPFMRVPMLFSYVRTETGISRYMVLGDRWQRRLVEILVTGNYSAEGLTGLNVEQFLRLLRRYRSLIFVSLTL